MIHYLNLNKVLKILSIAGIIGLMMIQVVFRLLSGQHSFTDIIGGMLLSTACVGVVVSLDLAFKESKEEKENN